jgi:molecular chaperone GrpE
MKSKDTKKTKEQKSKTDAEKSIEELQKQTEQLQAEKRELFEKLQRVSADYTNYQKRSPKQIADSVAYEKKAIIRSLLPSLDNFAHALAGAQSADGLEAVGKGIKLVFEHMLDALKAHGVKQIEAVGEQFDPSLHEAVQIRSEEDKEDNIVLEEFQTGYTLNGQVIRPSKVIVNKLTDKKTQEVLEKEVELESTADTDEGNDEEHFNAYL